MRLTGIILLIVGLGMALFAGVTNARSTGERVEGGVAQEKTDPPSMTWPILGLGLAVAAVGGAMAILGGRGYVQTGGGGTNQTPSTPAQG